MKTVVIEFEHFGPKRPLVNTCTLEFIQDPESSEMIITGIHFREPVRKMSYSQFMDLHSQIDNAIASESSDLPVSVDAGKQVALSGGVGKVRRQVDSLMGVLDGDMSSKEKGIIRSFLQMFDKEFKK